MTEDEQAAAALPPFLTVPRCLLTVQTSNNSHIVVVGLTLLMGWAGLGWLSLWPKPNCNFSLLGEGGWSNVVQIRSFSRDHSVEF